MNKGELIPLAKDVISNPSIEEGNDERMRIVDNEVTKEFDFLVAMESRESTNI